MDSIFIVGTGRSGTHFTCRAINGFSNVYDPNDGKEVPGVLEEIAQAAIYHKKYPQQALSYYESQSQQLQKGQVFLDQHHPNIFFTEDIEAIFESPVFLYPRRDVEQVVASMINHPGVMGWYDFARKSKKWFSSIPTVPFPNKFLGTPKFKDINELPLHLLCALRVLIHDRAAVQLSNKPNFKMVDYHSLVADQHSTFKNIFSEDEIRQLGKFTEIEKSQKGSLKKFQNTLNEEQINEIKALEKEYNFSEFKIIL